MVPGKFLHLQHLCIGAFTPDYDYFCLASLLDACPSLETFILSVSHVHLAILSIKGGSEGVQNVVLHCSTTFVHSFTRL